MFELSIACKYLIPRWKQLSVSIISLISMLVIALVVWLIVVFFSVKDGIEASWIEKLISLTAPVRLIPTEEYYRSYYYLVDSISSKSNYSFKTLREKLEAEESDPYDSSYDEELPVTWLAPDRDGEGVLKDPVKKAYQALLQMSDVPGLQASDFEMTVGTVRMRLLRKNTQALSSQQFVEQNAYIGTFDPEASSLTKTLIPLTTSDVNNLLHVLDISAENIKEDQPEKILSLPKEIAAQRINQLFQWLKITELVSPSSGWLIPKSLLPTQGEFQALLFPNKIVIPSSARNAKLLEKEAKLEKIESHPIKVKFAEGKTLIKKEGEPWKIFGVPIFLEKNSIIKANLDSTSLEKAKNSQELRFAVNFDLQGTLIQGITPLSNLEVNSFDFLQNEDSPFWLSKKKLENQKTVLSLPVDPLVGEGILLPRGFRESGVLIGDQGFLAYQAATASAIQEQRIPIFVAGFYDPGIMPIGGKYILAPRDTVAMIRAGYSSQESNFLSNGINVRFDNLEQASLVKSQLMKAFKEQGIAPYWQVQTYQEYDFTKDLIQQLHSEKNLFTLISTVIIIVACSNIISMLIILVNDKKEEIGVLRSMGATSVSIATIFGICGIFMGGIGSIIGIVGALLTLHHLDALVNMISHFQGHDLFNPVFYGDILPNEISYEALLFVVLATACISLLAGVVPAVKACMIRPSAILKSK